MMTNIFVCTVIYSSIIKYIFMQNLQIASSKQSTNRDGEREIIAFKSRSKAEKNVLSKTKKFTCLLRAILWSRFSLSMSLKKISFYFIQHVTEIQLCLWKWAFLVHKQQSSRLVTDSICYVLIYSKNRRLSNFFRNILTLMNETSIFLS